MSSGRESKRLSSLINHNLQKFLIPPVKHVIARYIIDVNYIISRLPPLPSHPISLFLSLLEAVKTSKMTR